MLGIDDVWVWGPYVLSLLATVGCVAYGLIFWNRDGETPPQPEDETWVEEERKIDESL